MPKLELPKGVIDSHDVTLFDITEKSDTDMMDIENNSFI